MKKSIILFLSAILLFSCSDQKQVAEWRSYASDQASTKYSSLDQINKENISQVTTAWEWESIDEPLLEKDSLLWTWKNESTPIMVNGVLYTSTSLSQVAALDAETGKTIWTYNPESYKNGNPPNLGFLHRGVAYWEKGDIKRIFIATGDAFLIGLNAITGLPDESF